MIAAIGKIYPPNISGELLNWKCCKFFFDNKVVPTYWRRTNEGALNLSESHICHKTLRNSNIKER